MRQTFKYPSWRRIRKRREYLACYEHGTKWHSAHFVLYLHAQNGGTGRFGIAVSRKVGNAVARNRVKRVLREFFRLHADMASGFEVVAVAKKNAGQAGYSQVCAELGPLFDRLSSAAPRLSGGS